ncbi:MAG: CobD/CbiB family protein [Rhodocyclaceae bacterium]|nr:CobD/CbiB family protein [Rhodocyclaceae bacterium]
MSFLSLILAFMLEQFRPLNAGLWVRAPLVRLSRFLEGRFNDGEARHGMIAWLLALLPACLLVALANFLLYRVQPVLPLIFTVAVLYLTTGFRQSSHYFTDIQAALRNEDLDRARALIGEWRGRGADRLGSADVARLSIEEALLCSHRNVFGVVFWFVALSALGLGPAGAVLYRMASFFNEQWGKRSESEFGQFGQFAARAFALLDWVPLRVTAVCFAIVGDFEDAIYCWRNQASLWADESSGILLASGAGALGVRLGMPVYESGEVTERPEMGLGDDADVDYMQSTVGLVWRALVLCLLLLLLFWLASLVG